MSQKQALQPEDLFALRMVGEVALAPHEDWVLYTESRPDKTTNKTLRRLMSVRPGSAPKPFTHGPDDHGARFAPDGQSIAFLSKRSGQEQIWLISAAGGEAEQLTRIDGGVEAFAWSSDGSRLVLTANIGLDGLREESADHEETLRQKYTKDVKIVDELAHKLDGVGFFGERRPHVCVIEARPGAQAIQLTQGRSRHESPFFSADGRQVLFATRRGTDYDRDLFDTALWSCDLATQRLRRVSPEPWSVGHAVPWGAGGYAYVAHEAFRDGYDNGTLLLQAADGSIRRLAAELDLPFGNEAINDMPGPSGAALTQVGTQLLSLVSDHATVQLYAIDPASGQPRALTVGQHVVYDFSARPDGSSIALAISQPTNPGDIYLLREGQIAPERLTHVNEELLSSRSLASPKRYTAVSADGTKVEGFVLKGSGQNAPLPTILSIHGGPMGMYGQAFFFEFQMLAGQGCAVVYGNPRGSLGYGLAFCEVIRPQWGEKDYQDVMALLDTALEQDAALDPERLGVSGGSYGGYLTNWIIGHSDRFKAAITMRSVVDWRSMCGSGDDGWQWAARAGNVPYWQDDSWYRQQSPITYVEQMRTPLLIEHQEGDLRCPIGQAEALYTALKFLDQAPVVLVRYPDEFHGMSRDGQPWHRVHRLELIADWWRKYLTSVEAPEREQGRQPTRPSSLQ